MDIPLLVGPRVRLRPWRAEDRDALFAMQSDPEVMKYLMPVPDRAASDAIADRIAAHFARFGFGLWVVEIEEVTNFAGYAGLVHVPYEEHFTPAVEIGWRFMRHFWGCGYATESAQLCLKFGFDALRLPEIVAITVPANERSRALMTRLGMTRDIDGDFDLPGIPDGHRLKRQVLYRLTATAFAAQAERTPSPLP